MLVNEISDIQENLVTILEKYNLVYQKLINSGKSEKTLNNLLDFTNYYSEIFSKIWLQSDSDRILKSQIDYIQAQIDIINNLYSRYYEKKDLEQLYNSLPRDNRFNNIAWNQNIILDYFKQSYFHTSNWIKNFIDNSPHLTKKEVKRYNFYFSQLLDAISPTNFPNLNPKVLEETLGTKGSNLIKGLDNLIRDIDEKSGVLNIKTANSEYFEIGKNIARTKGEVIYQNSIMQLIRYTPTVKQIYCTPLLVIPPCINKYYIFDLQEDKSFVNWMLSQGMNLYMISWVNPSEKLAAKNFENYMLEGVVEAINKIREDSSSLQVNTMGYCIGGTLLACTISYLKKQHYDWIKSATFLTTMLDFRNAGDLSIFIDEKQLQHIQEKTERQGFFDGKDMNLAFSLLKANDMIWSFYINNYLLGKEPIPFDILYWNQDSTRLPATMHSWYLKNMYIENNLIKDNHLTLGKQNISLSDIDIPCYFLSALDDHIAPWRTTFISAKHLTNAQTTFVLTSSGHVAGVMNHPSKNKYVYYTNDFKPDIPSKKWLDNSLKYEGSWWSNWIIWVSKYSDNLISLDSIQRKLEALEPAPGSYVLQK